MKLTVLPMVSGCVRYVQVPHPDPISWWYFWEAFLGQHPSPRPVTPSKSKISRLDRHPRGVSQTSAGLQRRWMKLMPNYMK